MYKSFYVFFFSFFFCTLAISQVKIKGKVSDAGNEKPLEFANVALLSSGDSSLINGATADLEGNFSFSAQPGSYILRVGFIGYENLYRKLELNENQVNLGNLRLAPGEETLDEVTVTGVTSMFESDIDKRVYNVENNILAEGGTASPAAKYLAFHPSE